MSQDLTLLNLAYVAGLDVSTDRNGASHWQCNCEARGLSVCSVGSDDFRRFDTAHRITFIS